MLSQATLSHTTSGTPIVTYFIPGASTSLAKVKTETIATRCARLADMAVRPISDDDHPFLRDVYGAARARELDRTGWPPEQLTAFIAQQFMLQHRYYHEHFVGADFLVLLDRRKQDDPRVGRLYWRVQDGEAVLMDISLLPDARNGGLGTAIMQLLTAYADVMQYDITLHVEPDNPAQRLYARAGFEVTDDHQVYWRMRRKFEAATREDNVLAAVTG